MAPIDNTKKPPQFDGLNYPYWKSKMTTHIKSINRKVWKVIETKIEIGDPENSITAILGHAARGTTARHEAHF